MMKYKCHNEILYFEPITTWLLLLPPLSYAHCIYVFVCLCKSVCVCFADVDFSFSKQRVGTGMGGTRKPGRMAGWQSDHCISRPDPTAILSCLSFQMTIKYSWGGPIEHLPVRTKDTTTHPVGLELDTPRHLLLPLVTGLLCHTL